MHTEQFRCPACQEILLVNLDGFPLSQGGNSFNIECPLCGHGFRFGYIWKPGPEPPSDEQVAEVTSGATGGSAIVGATPSSPGSPNDQRSNTLNPNNPASGAATDNRSNQMNPNNPAYRSSRGGGSGN